MGNLSRRSRMLTALRRGSIDKVPFATYNLHPYGDSPHRGDPSYADLLQLVEDRAGMYCKRSLPAANRSQRDPHATSKAFGYDIGGRRSETETRQPGRTVLTTTLHTPKGQLHAVRVTPDGQPPLVVEHFIKDDADLERYLSLPQEPAEFDVQPLQAFAAEFSEHGLIAVSYPDPMYATARLFSFEEFCIRYATERRSILRLVDHLFGVILQDVTRMAASCAGMEVIFLTGGPELATPPLMPPAAFRDLVVPYQSQLIDAIHSAGHLAMIHCHCHGRINEVLDYMIATGVDAIEPIEPPDQGNIPLTRLLERGTGRIAFLGHIQEQDLYTAPPGAARKRVEEIARVLNGGTGYVMAPTCTPFQHPASAAYLRNYSEWIEAASQLFGT